MMISKQAARLIDRGVTIPNPHSVEIGEDVDPGRISGDGVVLYSGTKLYGAKTLISAHAKLGYEAPVTVVNCQLGRGVELKGGFFKESVFLEKANMACGAQIREACILEEEANGSHTVGLKQTILFPFVTLGSLINFCDCFMAGGTSRKNHSEVGSSYIHFNYTPNQDKATASLIGDVPRGVMLDQPPIFLGGQGGLVGPARIGFGTVIVAGTVYRGDSPEGNRLLRQGNGETDTPFYPGFYGEVYRRVGNNICYLANLTALKQWYLHVRKPFFDGLESGAELYAGALEKLDMALKERLKRFEALAEKMDGSLSVGEKMREGPKKDSLLTQQRALRDNWPEIRASFDRNTGEAVAGDLRDSFLADVRAAVENAGGSYIDTIQSLNAESRAAGTAWLQSIVNDMTREILEIIPAFGSQGEA